MVADQSAKHTKPPPSAPRHPIDVIRRARDLGIREVIVGISCGKDSIATLSLCAENFDRIHGYFCFLVPGLSFQENYLAYLERKFSISIHRLPHFGLAALMRSGSFRHLRHAAAALPVLKPRHIDAHLRKITGCDWIATGEKSCDSVERNAMIRHVSGIDCRRRRLWPLAYWSHSTVYNHLKARQIALSPEYSQLATFSKMRSFGSLWWRDIAWIAEQRPDDFAKIRTLFPMIDGQLVRYQERARLQELGASDGQEEIGEPGILDESGEPGS